MRSTVGRTTLEDLYYDEKLSLTAVAERMQCSTDRINRAMDRYGLERRSRGGLNRKYSELDMLAVGESAILPKSTIRGKWQGSLYGSAKGYGIRVSIRQIDQDSIRVTRVE